MATTYNVGDIVWLLATYRHVRLAAKLLPCHAGPYHVLRCLSDVNYRCELINGGEKNKRQVERKSPAWAQRTLEHSRLSGKNRNWDAIEVKNKVLTAERCGQGEDDPVDGIQQSQK